MVGAKVFYDWAVQPTCAASSFSGADTRTRACALNVECDKGMVSRELLAVGRPLGGHGRVPS